MKTNSKQKLKKRVFTSIPSDTYLLGMNDKKNQLNLGKFDRMYNFVNKRGSDFKAHEPMKR